MTGKKYRPWNPTASYLFPPSPVDWLPEGHLAFFVLDVVDALDLRAITREVQRKDPRGTRPYDPKMMVALLLYGYCVGVVSSRKIELATYEDVAFRVISGGAHPDHSSISEFRNRHLESLRQLFVQSVRLSQEAGLVSLGRVALDGTKVQANASKHKAMSYERMLKTETELRREIDELLKEAKQIDRQEDEEFGKGRRGDEVPDELRRREDRLRKIQEAKAALEREARHARADRLDELAEGQREHAEQTDDPVEEKRALTRAAKSGSEANALRDDDDEPPSASSDSEGLPHNRVPATPDGKPKPKAQRNFTDPDSRIMMQGGSYVQAYNCQAAVDEKNQIIVASGLTNQAPDPQHWQPMLERVEENCARYPKQFVGDNGFWSEANVEHCEERGVDAYISVGRYAHGERAPPAGRGTPPQIRMREKLATEEGKKVYARRKAIVEPVFGQIKEARGLRRFLLRGLTKVRAEWDLWCATHNLLKLFRSGWAPA
jgi:transposase